MTPRRILLTGAGGFVGHHLQAVLAARFAAAEVVRATFDVTDAQAVQDGIAEARPDALVHLAAIAAPVAARDDPAEAWRVNLGGCLAVGRALLEAAPACTLLFTSSADAYGASFAAGVPLDETAPLAPQTTYGATKAAADLALGAMAADGLRVLRMRPFNHTGPGQSDAFAVPAFARQIARIEAGQQEPVLSVGALRAHRDFLDVRDVCAAYAAALARADALPPGTILNLASGHTRQIGDILAELLRLAGVAAEIHSDAGRVRDNEIAVAAGNAALARRMLDWSPQIPWEQTLQDVLDDWRARVGAPT